MIIRTCNDHQNSAVCFTGNECPLCSAMDYYTDSQAEIKHLKNEIVSKDLELSMFKEQP